MDPLSHFSKPTQAWFRSSFEGPTDVQLGTWPLARAGKSVLAVAPTGSGKTLAAFLWAIDRCLMPSAEPGVRVLYVSPLKALAVDVERNLRAPLTGIAMQTAALGLPHPQIRVGVRTGDTPASERTAMTRNPPDILITTPESLFLLLTSAARSMLTRVETIIVDELHAIAGSKRGAHLALSLARLDHLAGRTVARIGLSATVEPVDAAAQFLAPDGSARIVRSDSKKEWELSIQVPVPEMGDLGATIGSQASPSTSIWPHVEARIVDLIEANRCTLVFANSRRLAERLTARLNEIHSERLAEQQSPSILMSEQDVDVGGRVPAEVMGQSGVSAGFPPLLARAHHGSVSKEQRGLIEDDLKSGRLPAVVATSSLELGIDMGAVDLVIQVEAPPSVSSGLQRVGRAGHQVGAVSRGVIIPKFRSDLLASSVVVQRMREAKLEALRIPKNPLDVLAQQIVAMVAMDDWTVADLHTLLQGTAPFRELTFALLESVLGMLSGIYPSDAFAELRPRLVWDRSLDVLTARPGAQRLAVTSGGTIPDRGMFGVHLEGGGRVGELDEEMVYESRVGDVVALGATSWRVIDITHDRVVVVPAPGSPGRLPFWRGDTLGRSAEVGRAIGSFTRELSGTNTAAAIDRLKDLGLDDWAAQNLLTYLSEQESSGSHIPTDRILVVERSRDELGDWRIILLSPFGARVHAPWALVVRERIQERFGLDAAVSHGDDGIVARIPDTTNDDWVSELTECLFPPADTVENSLARLIGSSALFAARFRESASRALLLPRVRPGRRAPLWQQRQRSAQLLQIAAEHPTFPIVLEAVRECLQDVYDVPALVGLLSEIEQGKVLVIEAAPNSASPFARSLLFGYIAEYLYEGDSPLAERRAAALTLDPRLLADLLGQTDLRELLEPAAISHVESTLQRLTTERHARSAEDAADLLRSIGPLTEEAALARGIQPSWLADLTHQRRAIHVRMSGAQHWAAIEDAARLRDGLGVVLPLGLPVAHLQSVADPVGDIVNRYARTHGPFTPDSAAMALGMASAVVAAQVLESTRAGRLIEGRFLVDAAGTQMCHPEVLRMIKRRSIALLRDQIEPVSATTLGVFLPRWHGIGAAGSRRLRGIDGVFEAIRQLAGTPIPVSALESSILPARIADYTPSMLDTLTTSGEVRWCGCSPLPGGDARIALAPAELGNLLPRNSAPNDDLVAIRLLELLQEGGGWFHVDLIRRIDSSFDSASVGLALRSLLWSGLVSNDTLEPVRPGLNRAMPGHGANSRRTSSRFSRVPRGRYSQLWRPPEGSIVAGANAAARVGQSEASLPGRWFALPESGMTLTAQSVATAESLLARFGLVTRPAVLASGELGGFTSVYRTLVAMGDAGRVQRVYAVEGLGAAQFAYPGVIDQLREIEQETRDDRPEVVVLAASDPANPYGAALDWPPTAVAESARTAHRPSRSAGTSIVLRNGHPIIFLERGGRSLVTFETTAQDGSSSLDHVRDATQALAEAVRIGRVPKVDLTRINGGPAVSSEQETQAVLKILQDSGFTATPRGVRLRM